MLIINVKEEESIDRALKRYKRKVNSTKIIKELRNRKNYTKPSVVRRNEILVKIHWLRHLDLIHLRRLIKLVLWLLRLIGEGIELLLGLTK